MKGKTTKGFEYEIDDRVVKDWRFLKLVRESEKDYLAFLDATECMLGEEQTEKLIKLYTDDDGYSDTEKILAEVTEIVEDISELKN